MADNFTAECIIYFVYCGFFYVACYYSSVHFLNFINELIRKYSTHKRNFTTLPILHKKLINPWKAYKIIYFTIFMVIYVLDVIFFIITCENVNESDNQQSVGWVCSLINVITSIIMLIHHILQIIAAFYLKKYNNAMSKKMTTNLILFGITTAGYRSLRNIYAGVIDMFQAISSISKSG